MSRSLEKITVVIPRGCAADSLAACLDRLEALDMQWREGHSDSLFASIQNGLEQVKSPYAMVLDPRDILLPRGLAGLVDYLDATPSHPATAGLHIIHDTPRAAPAAGRPRLPFDGAPGLRTPADLWAAEEQDLPAPRDDEYRIALPPRNHTQATSAERTRALGESIYPAYNALYRTEVLASLVEQRVESDIGDPLLSELLVAWDLARKGPFTLHGSYATHLTSAGRMAHLKSHHAFYNRFFDPDLMDQFHTAVGRQAHRAARMILTETAAGESLLAKLGAFLRPPRNRQAGSLEDLRPRQENLIRESMGRFVHNLTTNAILMADSESGSAWGDLKKKLTDCGMPEDAAVETMAEMEALCATPPDSPRR